MLVNEEISSSSLAGTSQSANQRNKIADSSTATPSGQKIYKPLKDQLEQLKKAIQMASTGTIKPADKEFQTMKGYVEKLLAAQHKTLEDREPLHMVFKSEGESCERRRQNLQQETLGRAVDRKTKAEMKSLKENHGKCFKWMIMCQGISTWMKEEVEKSAPHTQQEEQVLTLIKSLHELQQENKKLEGQIQTLTMTKEKLEHAPVNLTLPFNAVHTASGVLEDTARLYTLPAPTPRAPVNIPQQLYPWSTLIPSAPPPPYAFPVMSLAGGEIRGPNGQTGTVIGGFADVTHISPSTTGQPPGAQPAVLQPMDGGGTSGATAKAGG